MTHTNITRFYGYLNIKTKSSCDFKMTTANKAILRLFDENKILINSMYTFLKLYNIMILTLEKSEIVNICQTIMMTMLVIWSLFDARNVIVGEHRDSLYFIMIWILWADVSHKSFKTLILSSTIVTQSLWSLIVLSP